MRRTISVRLLAGLVVLSGCESLPPLDYESEHARVGTDAAQICAGTLARIDAEIEYVDAQLGRETDAKPARIWIVDSPTAVEFCPDAATSCVTHVDGDSAIILRRRGFEAGLTHEIVHERVSRTAARGSKPLFTEGIAVAIGKARKRPTEEHTQPTSMELLGATSSKELRDAPYGYTYASELTHWLITTYGMSEVLGFMASLDRQDEPDLVRHVYAEHFIGRSIDEDLFAHWREEDELTPANVLCTAVELPRNPDRARFRLEADLACDSRRVETDFNRDGQVYVAWTIQIDEGEEGFWGPVRRPGDDALPEGTMLWMESCLRDSQSRVVWTPTRNDAYRFEPGLHQVRWYGPQDGDTQLALELAGPCDVSAQDCGSDEVCVPPGRCIPDL